ncbi:MAG TPA: hypothetical protein VGO63_02250 [Candidatus Paceibacterota bacterium]|jgi:uncharacterized protein YpmB|nr:hypothetical protein [Candidatus Paceibacterota bacterium]
MNIKVKRLILILVILVVILGIATAYFFYRSNKLAANAGSAAASQAEARTLAAKVGKIMVLPTDEVPTIATVSDPEALKGQVFFADAKVGDKVLIYTNAKKAVLYDPEVNKIVNVAPLNVGSEKAAAPAPLDASASPAKENEF